jgi:hypothetical protein
MVDRSVILVADAGVAIEGGLTLPPGYYRAVKRRIEGPTPSKPQPTDPEYLIELSGRQIVAMGGTLGAAGLISANVDVTRQAREGLLRLSDRPPATVARRAFEYRSRGTFPGAAGLQKPGVQNPAGRAWERVRSDLAERFRKVRSRFPFIPERSCDEAPTPPARKDLACFHRTVAQPRRWAVSVFLVANQRCFQRLR